MEVTLLEGFGGFFDPLVKVGFVERSHGVSPELGGFLSFWLA
jgi:hypothetical protein